MPISTYDVIRPHSGTMKTLVTFAVTILLCFIYQSQALSADLTESTYFPIAMPVASHGNLHVTQFRDHGMSGILRKKDDEEDDGDCDDDLPTSHFLMVTV